MTVQRLFVVTFVVALLVMPVRETLDPDMWWHLETGEYILERGIPHQDVFSYTVPDNEWITHEWLSDVLMALIHRVGGMPTLMIAFAGVVALTFWLVYRRCVGRPYLAVFVTLLGAFASSVTWGARPQMFNMLGLAVFVYVVEGVKDRELTPRAFWILPLLTAIWVNLHSGYLLGVVLLGVYVVGEVAQKRFGPSDERQLGWPLIRHLAVVTVLCFVAAAFNPNGYRLWIYPFETLGSDAMQTHIQEWKSPNFHQSTLWPFGAMLVGGMLSLALSRKRPTWSDLLLFFGTGVAGLNSARHIQIFGVVATPIVARYALSSLVDTPLYSYLRGEQSHSGPTRLQAILHWGIVGLLALVGAVRVADVMRKNDAAIAATYPVEAVDFLEQEGWETRRTYNDYNWGGYLIWRGLPVFVDGRADVYWDEFLFYYLQAYQAEPTWREPLDEFDVDYVLMARDTPLTVVLTEAEGWEEAYRDDVAQIFVRAEE